VSGSAKRFIESEVPYQNDCLFDWAGDNPIVLSKRGALVMPNSLRSLLTLAIGVIIGLLIGWGVFKGFSTGSANSLAGPNATPNQAELQPSASTTPFASEKPDVVEARPSPSSTNSPGGQVNGLPAGVTREALNYNKELYQKYPGLQPPHINTDGRDLSQEAIKSIQGSPTLLTNPGPSSVNAFTPAPIPLLNRDASPSPSPSAN
jgi:hypothetical protein